MTTLDIAWCIAESHNILVPNAKPVSPRLRIGDIHIVSCQHGIGFSFEVSNTSNLLRSLVAVG